MNPTWILKNVLQKVISLVHYLDHIAIFIASFQVVPSVIYHKQLLFKAFPGLSQSPYHLTSTVDTDSFLQFSLTLAFSNQLLILLLTTIFCLLLTYTSLLEGPLHKLTQRSFFKGLTSFYLDTYAQTVDEETSGFFALSSLLMSTYYFLLY